MKQEVQTEELKVKPESLTKVDNLLLEQYKIMIATTSEVTKNRQNTNSFYFALNTFLLGIVNVLKDIPMHGIVLLCIVGIALSVFWFVNIQSYQNLNRAKFKVIQEIEKDMPAKIFTNEEKAYKCYRHISFTSIEKCIPVIFIILYIIIITYKLLFKSF